MAAKGVSYIKWKKVSGKCFMTALASALLEWLLILMLLMNGVFAYLITCFARYCDLPLPCMLCSRLDHVFGSQKVGNCWDLMCKSHKSEISSLVMCTLHQKLVDVHGMCENCLFSFATKDKSNPETYRLLVGKLGIESENDIDHQKPISHGAKLCCCCNEPWSFRSNAQALLQTKSVEIERDDVDLTRELRLNWNSANNENRKPFFMAARSDLHESFEDCSPHFGYSELKLNSDSESDDHEIEEPKESVSETFHSQKHLKVDSLHKEPQVLNVFSESSSLIDHEESQCDMIKSHDIISEISMVQDSTLLETPNLIDDWMKPQEDAIPEPSDLVDHKLYDSDLIESNEAPSTISDPVGHGLEELDWQDIDLKIESSPQSDQISTDNVIPESPNPAEIQADPSKDHEVSDCKDSDQASIEVNNSVNDGGFQVQPTNSLELSDAYKLAVSSRGRQLSGKTLERFLGRDSTRVSEDLKLLLSQLSLARGLDLPLTGMISPRISGNMEDSKALDSLALIGMQLLQKRISLERNDSRNSLDRNESGFESLDISTVGEIDGETELETLKRQIEHDKKFMSALYKELEEERNASAVAANQALAMITRLQEEKAALQMEALHDIRMMEDQAEYDVEALDRANEVLAEKEKEIQDLEAELDYYRLKYPDDDELMLDNEELILHQNQSSWLGFEDERLYISQRLSNLEKKLHLFSNTGIYPELQNGDCFNMEEEKKARKDDHDVLLQTKNSASFGVRRSLVRRVNSLKTPRAIVEDSLVNTDGDVGSEVSNLNERLQALEADRNFLEHSINSLRNGEEGVRFLREIASHLQELRRELVMIS
ncbi:hypothetical protein V2J09_007933 [Rumex salicifolius]